MWTWITSVFAQMNWTLFGAIATAATGMVILVSVVVLWRQLREAQHAIHAQAFLKACDVLQSEEVRDKRKTVFSLSGRAYGQWKHEETSYKAAESVCHTFDAVAIAVRYEFLKKEMIIDHWGGSLTKLWPIVEPLVQERRRELNFPGAWDDIEWLAKEATRVLSSRYPEARPKVAKRQNRKWYWFSKKTS